MTVDRSLRRLVWERDGGICGICSLPVPFDRTMHADHIHPRSAGGPDTPENLRPTHQHCNLGRTGDGRGRWGSSGRPGALRITTAQRDSIRRAAAEDRRSLNSEIQALLDDALEIRARQRARRAQQLDEIAEELR